MLHVRELGRIAGRELSITGAGARKAGIWTIGDVVDRITPVDRGYGPFAVRCGKRGDEAPSMWPTSDSK